MTKITVNDCMEGTIYLILFVSITIIVGKSFIYPFYNPISIGECAINGLFIIFAFFGIYAILCIINVIYEKIRNIVIFEI